MRIPLLLLMALLSFVQAEPVLRPDPPHKCTDCANWNRPHEPFRIFGNSYSVGVAGLSAILITSGSGAILLDGGLPQSAPLIDRNIRALGFRTGDIRLIVNSHAHYDHAGGIAALQRLSGAMVAASAAGAKAIERGEPTPDDPQYGFGRAANGFPAVPHVRAVADGETLHVGDLAITAHAVPGHTPGATTWTWRACEAARCYDIVYADSLNAVSAPGFKFTPIAEQFRKSIGAVAALPCDILLTVHPGFVRIDEKLAARGAHRAAGDVDPFVDSQACRAYAAEAEKRLDARIAEER